MIVPATGRIIDAKYRWIYALDLAEYIDKKGVGQEKVTEAVDLTNIQKLAQENEQPNRQLQCWGSRWKDYYLTMFKKSKKL